MEVMWHILCVAILIMVAENPTVSLDDKYCETDLCPEGVQHVACGATSELAFTCPTGSRLIKPNMQLQEYILNAINEKRNFIAGGFDSNHSPACRMATMQWDDELATLAEINAAQCKLAPDSCHNTNAFPYSGQLRSWLAFVDSANDKIMFDHAINKWYAEVRNSYMSFINSYPANKFGVDVSHFTLLMLERNIRIGCGASDFSLLYGTYRSYLIVCNFAYNIVVGEPVYESCQSAGSRCKTGKNLKYPNLCAKSEEYRILPGREESSSQPEPISEEISTPTPNTIPKKSLNKTLKLTPKIISNPKTTVKPKKNDMPKTTPQPKKTVKAKSMSKPKKTKPHSVSYAAKVVGGLVSFIS